MKKVMKSIGWGTLSFVPLITSIVAQFGVSLLGGMLIMIVIIFTSALSGDGASGNMMNQFQSVLMSSASLLMVIYHLLAILIFSLWYYFGCGRPKACKPAKVFGGNRSIPVTLLTGLGLCVFANGFVVVIMYALPTLYARYEQLMESAGMGTDVFAILAAILLAPVGEEILCRGLIYHYAKNAVKEMKNRQLAFWIANIIQSLAFGIMHMNMVQGMYAFVLGLGIGWLRERYNSLYPAMLAHFTVNFLSTFVMGYLLAPLPENLASGILLMVISFVICGIAFVLEFKSKKTVEAEG